MLTGNNQHDQIHVDNLQERNFLEIQKKRQEMHKVLRWAWLGYKGGEHWSILVGGGGYWSIVLTVVQPLEAGPWGGGVFVQRVFKKGTIWFKIWNWRTHNCSKHAACYIFSIPGIMEGRTLPPLLWRFPGDPSAMGWLDKHNNQNVWNSFKSEEQKIRNVTATDKVHIPTSSDMHKHSHGWSHMSWKTNHASHWDTYERF